MSGTSINIKNLTVAYDKKPVIENVSIEFPKGELIAIVGPNGAGKTSLIKAITELVKPISGKVEIFGKTFKEESKKIAYVPQRAGIDWDFPISVFDTVIMGTYGKLGWLRKPGKREKAQTLKMLQKLEISEHAKKQIGELSGGQQQRMFIARALIQDAEIYLLDEPFQGVDAVTENKILNIFRELKDAGKTIICVHHDLTTVEEYFDYVMLLNKEVVKFGKTEEIFTDKNIKETYTLKI